MHCCEAPRFNLSNYFGGKKKLIRVTFWKIHCIQIQIQPQTSFKLKYGELNMKVMLTATDAPPSKAGLQIPPKPQINQNAKTY